MFQGGGSPPAPPAAVVFWREREMITHLRHRLGTARDRTGDPANVTAHAEPFVLDVIAVAQVQRPPDARKSNRSQQSGQRQVVVQVGQAKSHQPVPLSHHGVDPHDQDGDDHHQHQDQGHQKQLNPF